MDYSAECQRILETYIKQAPKHTCQMHGQHMGRTCPTHVQNMSHAGPKHALNMSQTAPRHVQHISQMILMNGII